MKNLLLTLALTLSCLSIQAKQITSKTFNTDIDCPSCTQKVLRTLPYQKGIKDVKVDLTKGTIAVDYDSEKTNEQKIVQTLNKLDIKVRK